MPTNVVPRRLRLSSLLTGLVAVVAGPTLTSVPAQAARVEPAVTTSVRATYGAPVPHEPAGLPSGIEALSGYVPANSCDPHAKPGTTALGDLLRATYPGSSYGIDRTCGTDPLPTSEHYDGRALDFFRRVDVPEQRAQIRALVAWLFADDAEGRPYANARRLGIMYLIWDNRIWGSYRAADGWRPYAGCAARTSHAYDTTCHRDHLHVSLSWEGAMARTSFWTGRVAATDHGPCREDGLNWAAPYDGPRATPCPAASRPAVPSGASSLLRTLTTYAGMVLGRGDTGPVVAAVQRAVGAGPDGDFGPLTEGSLRAWQSAHGVTPSGVADAATWRALLGSRAVAASTSTPGGTAGGATSGATGGTVAHPELSRYRARVLARGSHGPAVLALQRRLRMPHTPGTFGVRTAARVRSFQRDHGVPATGVVGPRTWAALGA